VEDWCLALSAENSAQGRQFHKVDCAANAMMLAGLEGNGIGPTSAISSSHAGNRKFDVLAVDPFCAVGTPRLVQPQDLTNPNARYNFWL
jgi:hypothetical protein